MAVVLVVWLMYAAAAIVQLFTTGAKVLESLPPFWFWGIPVAPYSAMYAPWRQMLPGGQQQPPTPPSPPSTPATPQPPEATS